MENLGLKGQKTPAACPRQTNDPKNGPGEVEKKKKNLQKLKTVPAMPTVASLTING